MEISVDLMKIPSSIFMKSDTLRGEWNVTFRLFRLGKSFQRLQQAQAGLSADASSFCRQKHFSCHATDYIHCWELLKFGESLHELSKHLEVELLDRNVATKSQSCKLKLQNCSNICELVIFIRSPVALERMAL